jgi:hypothetical protein
MNQNSSMKNAFLLTGLVSLIYVITLAIQSAAVGSFIVNYLPVLAGGYAAVAILAIALDDCRRIPPTLPTNRRAGDPTFAGPGWRVNGALA